MTDVGGNTVAEYSYDAWGNFVDNNFNKNPDRKQSL